MSLRVFQSPLEASACLSTIRDAAGPETIWKDDGTEAPILRVCDEALQLRFQRLFLQSSVHNWFQLKVSAASGGGSLIEVSERRALSRGWWVLGAFLALPTALATKSVLVALLVFVVPEAFLVTTGVITAAETIEKDRRRLKNFMSRMLSAEEAA